ncbi:winged helix-turn-helix domain-containing protein [Vibrio sp. TRT 21S02]|uniref:winged helix-turn-helix domain-containing protein n=1 Tax=unclassified Vibrio TaxID=2614977 RepID=UPI00349F7B13
MSNIGTKFNLANRFTFDPNTNSLVDKANDNEIIRLGSNESRILLLLCEKPSEIISRNDLHDFVWREQGFEVDDSSLTQAISTLRKMLKDSTKSPQFVKTVPKRGYQLICSVERSTPLLAGEAEGKEEPSIDDITITTTDVVEPFDGHATDESIAEDDAVKSDKTTDVITPAPSTPPASNPWVVRILLTLALLIPLIVVLISGPSESNFRELAVYDEVPIRTPINHPDLQGWMPSIERCVKKYNESHSGEMKPIEIIATGGQNNQLILNYIHSLNHSGENVTLRIVAEQDDLDKVCN